jgi:hypothetical protein
MQPGANGEAATMQMLNVINSDKAEVTTFCNEGCAALWLDAACVCDLTHACPCNPNKRLACRKPSDIGVAWKQSPGPVNCKRMAFMFHHCGAVVCQRAVNTSHQNQTTREIMTSMNIVMDVLPSEMRSGQKTCVEQRCSCCAKNGMNNLLRGGCNKHHVRVNLEQGKNKRLNQNWRRPKDVFFICRNDNNNKGERFVEQVG